MRILFLIGVLVCLFWGFYLPSPDKVPIENRAEAMQKNAGCLAFGFVLLLVPVVIAANRKPEPKAEIVPISNNEPKPETYIRVNDRELTGGGLIGKPNGVFLGWPVMEGERNKLSFMDKIPLKYGGDRHLITFGPIGSGKNATSQTPALLTYEGSAVVIDVKGQLASISANQRRKMGHKIFVINPFDTLGIATATYNPLSHLDLNSFSFSADCKAIAEGLVTVQKSDYWEISALDVVALLVQWTVLYEEEKTLLTVRRLLNLPDDLRQTFFKGMMEKENPAISEGGARYSLDSKEVRDCIQTAVVQLSFLRDSGICRVLKGGKGEISFADLKKKKQTVYLIIPPELLHTHGKFLRLLVLSAIKELMKERTRPKDKVLFMLDEFAQLGVIAGIENYMSVSRDYQIQFWLILQNIPQLKALYGDKWQSFLSSAGVVQFFTPNDLETAKYISERGGEIEKRRIISSYSSSTSMTSGTNSGGTVNGYSNGSSSSTSYNNSSSSAEQFYNERAIKPEAIFSLEPSRQFLLIAGFSQIALGARLPYWRDLNFDELAEKDPYHMNEVEQAAFMRQIQATGL